VRVRLVQSTLEEHIPLDSLGRGGLPHAPPPPPPNHQGVCFVRTLRAPPPAWLESGTPPDNSSRHIIAAGTFAAADPAHIIVAGSERRAPRPPLAHPPTLAHTACRTALAPARSRSHDLYTTHGTHLDKNHKRTLLWTFCATRTLCRDRQASRCRDRQAVATPLSQAAAVASRRCPLSRWSS
jgi:hypothetical protein